MEMIKASLERSLDLKQKVLEDDSLISAIQEAANCLQACFEGGFKLMTCGNGGSTCDAMHIAEELTGRFEKDRRPLPAIPLTDASHITCTANDFGFDSIFSRALEAYGKPGDVLMAFSTSGNSTNVLKAVEKAKTQKIKTICLTGEGGGKLAEFGDIVIAIPSKETSRIQEVHITVAHIILEILEEKMFD